MESIKGLVQKIIDSAGLGKEYLDFRIRQILDETVPEDIAKGVCSFELKNDVLLIFVEDSELKKTLEPLKVGILFRLRKEFQDVTLSSVKLCVVNL